MTSELPPYVPVATIAARLALIFPPGTPHRGYCTRELAAKTVFAALYVGAVAGTGRFFGPIHVYRMTQEQSEITDPQDRLAYSAIVLGRKGGVAGQRWYADNTREPIRDETLRDGLVVIGAVMRREDLPTTSGLPRYALVADFAALFDPELAGDELEAAISDFRKRHLSKEALSRISIMLSGAAAGSEGHLVTFPNGETRQLAAGPSSIIAKAVIETFAPRFLERPAILWLSESGNKVVVRDDRIALAIGLKIEADKNLPDLILADVGGDTARLLFVEVVATDGAMTERRRAALIELTDQAGFDRAHVAFLTAYRDRDSPGFKRTVAQLAWGSFAWFASEPDKLVSFANDAAHGEVWLDKGERER